MASIRWQPPDEESAERPGPKDQPASAAKPRPNLQRSLSAQSRRSIDPSSTFPIEYRSVSIEIGEAQRNAHADKAKNHVVSEFQTIDWHKLSVGEVQARLKVDASQGLSNGDAEERQKKFGKNKISPLPNPLFKKIMVYLFGGFGSVLIIGGVLVFISWKPLGSPPAVANLALGIVLVAVFVIQAVFNAWQDWSSSRVMQSITDLLPDSCHLLRNGKRVDASAQDIVQGDVLIIKSGNRIPADVRFIEASHDAYIDRAVLTGESKPIRATVDSTDDNYLETQCIGLQGTYCVSGTTLGVVVAIGDSTVFGRIAKLTGSPRKGLTTMEKDMYRFVLLIVVIMLTWIVIVAAVWGGWLRKEHPNWISVSALIVSCVSVAIAYIPEGLPIAITSSLTITANIMKKNNILCKSLKTVETLGSVSVICSDKTGTLTMNKMSVSDCAINLHTFTAAQAKEEYQSKKLAKAIDQVWAISALCNSAVFETDSQSTPLNERHIIGDATDQAALRYSEGLRSVTTLTADWKAVFELAFDSRNKFMAKAFLLRKDGHSLSSCLSAEEAKQFNAGENILLTTKGAPDILLERCTSVVMPDGQILPLSSNMKEPIEKLKDEWSSQGKRVILLARKLVDSTGKPKSAAGLEAHLLQELRAGLTLVGLIGIIDPPRPEIQNVVSTLRTAGIRVFMVTGDFGKTALAISRQCKIVTGSVVHDASHLPLTAPLEDGKRHDPPRDAALLLTGKDLISLSDHQWERLCAYSEIVFSRTTPDQKLRIVREFQSRGQIVAMTGDGVNDAPALKAADVGISLAGGSDIAIQAADMVLLDSFTAIVEAVRYGRVVFDNLKKVIAYLLPAGSWSEFWPVFTNVVFGLPQILSSFLMIIICCFTDCAGAIVLAYEKPETDVMLRPPRDPRKAHLVNWQLIFHSYAFVGMVESICSFAMSYWYLERKGIAFSDLWFKFGELPAGIDQDYYNARLIEASSIYFMNLVVMQWFNLMAVRTRHLSILQHPPLFNKSTQNLLLFPAILFSLGIAVLWLYVPQLQKVLSTAGVPVEHYFYPAALGLGLFCLDEIRKACVRRWPRSVIAKMAW